VGERREDRVELELLTLKHQLKQRRDNT